MGGTTVPAGAGGGGGAARGGRAVVRGVRAAPALLLLQRQPHDARAHLALLADIYRKCYINTLSAAPCNTDDIIC